MQAQQNETLAEKFISLKPGTTANFQQAEQAKIIWADYDNIGRVFLNNISRFLSLYFYIF